MILEVEFKGFTLEGSMCEIRQDKLRLVRANIIKSLINQNKIHRLRKMWLNSNGNSFKLACNSAGYQYQYILDLVI